MKKFLHQFQANIDFTYSCFDRVIVRGYILKLFTAGGIVFLLRTLGFNKISNSIMRILTDQLNAHIEKEAKAKGIPIHWWPAVDGGKDGAKSDFVTKHYANRGPGQAIMRSVSSPILNQPLRMRQKRSTGKWKGEIWDRRKNGQVYP
ncbi:MAG: hypothetical protein HQL73_05395, partial [Magnetococcales bacterium]|nr:hypothetical protein [Magnetococcales bacterium]